MEIAIAQADLRRAYVDGGPGIVISGLVWLAAAFVEARNGVPTGFAVLFFGGMAIFPLALLVDRVLFRRAKESPDNPYGRLVLESTIAMIAMLFAAWLVLPHYPALTMPIAALAVGTHYFAFRTAYGDAAFWVLGAIISVLGFAGIYQFLPLPGGLVLLVGATELLFGLFLTIRAMRRDKGQRPLAN